MNKNLPCEKMETMFMQYLIHRHYINIHTHVYIDERGALGSIVKGNEIERHKWISKYKTMSFCFN